MHRADSLYFSFFASVTMMMMMMMTTRLWWGVISLVRLIVAA